MSRRKERRGQSACMEAKLTMQGQLRTKLPITDEIDLAAFHTFLAGLFLQGNFDPGGT
jgi:hypothetical protein